MRPESEAEVCEIVRGGSGQSGALSLRGGGTRGVLTGGEALDLSGLAGVRLYEPGALTLVAGAGTALAEVEALLAGERQRLAFEPPDLRGVLGREGVSTLGGVVAMNAAGPRRMQAGAARDHLLGVRFVDGTGAVVKSGGRVMKNVTGLDLVRLMAGSQGTLGVLTEVALKVQAMPEAVVTLGGPEQGAKGLACLRRALGSPFDISGAAMGAFGSWVRIEGMAGSVAYRAGRLKELLPGWEEVEADWGLVRDAPVRGAEIWRLSVVPSEAWAVAEALPGADLCFDWAGGLIWVGCEAGTAVREAVRGRGHAMLLRGPSLQIGGRAWGEEAPGVARLMAGVKAKFDPRGVFNPGGMV
ncbi:FAD-binding protein [Stagnihabitans tardus]|uniref:FAD-binding protein n=1 Tax=Stagnihabitans tardus TaxID=2699202 RepID=A0AAE4YB17_9RHOB|nr:FAD-binding protein [Stagnihabitans tardus]NBZ86650.1 FAD-binding protein [Stagnihabitans tardus]